MKKISAVYKIVNTITNDCYVGSSKDVRNRWYYHKCPSCWKLQPNNPLYQDMQKYGLKNFRFQILCPVEPEHLNEVEQELIEMIQPAYNDRRANGPDVERRKEYIVSNRYKEAVRKGQKKYDNQLCFYNGKTVKLNTLVKRFRKAGLEHPTLEAKKYLRGNNDEE